jgi:hypothetical protein
VCVCVCVCVSGVPCVYLSARVAGWLVGYLIVEGKWANVICFCYFLLHASKGFVRLGSPRSRHGPTRLGSVGRTAARTVARVRRLAGADRALALLAELVTATLAVGGVRGRAARRVFAHDEFEKCWFLSCLVVKRGEDQDQDRGPRSREASEQRKAKETVDN